MGQGNNWVDFKQIKEKVSMEMLLEHYMLLENLKPSGGNLIGCCPIHKGTNKRQFSVNPEKNAYYCFGDCGGGGNVLDFVSKIEGVTIREAGALIQKWFSLGGGNENGGKEKRAGASATGAKLARQELAREGKRGAGAVVNPPLTFRLKGLATDHGFFSERGLTAETVNYFGLGFCNRGLMRGRVVIPIHNEAGELVAYCGRA
ncbi:MAG: hypothetical protein KGZ82_05770, partial [Bacteroidales bacterium]|nr:hypothetical protein [Bacteroidales bacterium]